MANDDQEFIEDENQMETEEDIGLLGKDTFTDAVVSGNDWTTETIVNQINKGNIQLNPSFQRRDAWDLGRKSRFIESLILGLPVPQIVLAESKDQRGAYIVLDGKQRLLSIRQFFAHANDPNYDQLKLASLEIRSDLKGKNINDMRDDVGLFDDLSALENQPIRTVVIKNWPDEAFLYHVFLRLNTGSVPLSTQELRQALHPGPFVTFLDYSSSNSNALKEILKLSKPDFRMRDAELLLRYYAFKNFLSEYTGTLKTFLDECCLKFNKDWNAKEAELAFQLNEFEQAHLCAKSIFGKYPYRKWNGNNAYENRFNRSIFDVMIISFSDKDVRRHALGKEKEIEDGFKELCLVNIEFRNSIESTTKSLAATYTRLALWNAKLNAILGIQMHVPQLINNRIV